MKTYNIAPDEITAAFYEKAATALGCSPETLMERAVFIAAGEIALTFKGPLV